MYYRGCQHQYKSFTWDGVRMPADGSHSGTDADIMPGFYVPMRSRRPSVPYHLAKVIVDRFTALLFGEGRWPEVKVDGDDVADDFLRAVCTASGLRTVMIQARSLGGAMGSVALSYKWFNGRPRVEVQNAKHIYVQEWEDREDLVPRVVLKTFKYPREEYDFEKKQVVRCWYRYCRMWTPEADIRYKPVKIEKDKEPTWEVEEEVEHKLGFCPFVWIQNLPSEDVDGEPDYAGLTDDGCGRGLGVFDQIDTLLSAVTFGGLANVDPTLVLKVDPALFNETLLRKGSSNALKVGVSGDARYLELAGSSLDVGIRLAESIRKYALEVAQCVLADPEKISGAAQSAKAISYLYAPMLAKADVLREQYGQGLRRVLDGLRGSAAALKGGTFVLPPRREEVKDEATNEVTTKFLPRNNPGGEGSSSLVWRDYFDPTPQDVREMVAVAQVAAGGRAVVSQESAMRYVAAIFGIEDVSREMERVDADEAASREGREALFEMPAEAEEPAEVEPAAALAVSQGTELPVAAAIDSLPPKIAQQAALGEKLEIYAYHLDSGVVTINEARARLGLPAVAWGNQTVAEYKAGVASRMAAEGLDPEGKPLTKKLKPGAPPPTEEGG
jgi:hypothetical protein